MTSLRSAVLGVTAASMLMLPGTVTTAAADSSPTAASPVATAASRHHTSVRFLSFDHTRAYGSTTSVRGQVIARIGGDNGSVAGVRVTLLRQLDGSSNWRSLGVDFTSRSGFPKFVFDVKSRANATYRAVYNGNKRLEPSSNRTSVSVYRTFSASLEDGSGRFHGRVSPHYAHKAISLDKRSCATCGWRRVSTARTGDKGVWSFKVGAPRHGRSFWRVATPASSKFVKSYSGVFTTQRG